jgi:glucose-1-phosphate adenylyltransferase
MDVRQMIAFHRERRADVTVSAVGVPLAQASHFGVLGTGADGRISEFKEKPQRPPAMPSDPARAYASMGNYLFDPKVLERALIEARRRGDTDFGRDVLPRLCTSHNVYAYDFANNRIPGLQDHEEPAYWRDVGTLAALAAAQQDAMGNQPRFNLWNRRWPIRGEFDAALLARIRGWREQALAEVEAPLSAPAWQAANRDRRSDERLQPS